MPNHSKNRDPRFWRRWEKSGAVKHPHILLVWHNSQRVPATVYGKAHYGLGHFNIEVCADPNERLKELGGSRATIYHFA